MSSTLNPSGPMPRTSSFPSGVRMRRLENPPRRTAPYEQEPGYFEPAGLWLYGRFRLFDANLACVPASFGSNHLDRDIDAVEHEAEELVLDGKILVCGIHNRAHQRAALVPLRWGAPRIVVVSGGFYHHLGPNLKEELFRAAKLWRYEFDAETDLIVSRRAPDKKPTFATRNPTVDRVIACIAKRDWPGLRSPSELVGAGNRSSL